MISLSGDVLAGPQSDVRQRHERYGAAAGHLTMIIYAAGGGGRPPASRDFSPHLAVHPIGGSRALFVPRAVWTGLRRARRPVDLVTTQDPFATGLAGVILSWLLKTPLLVQNHSAFFDNPDWIAERPRRHAIFNRLGKWVIRRAAMNRVVNEAERDKYLALGIPPERVRVIPLADPAPFAAPVPAEQIAAQRAAWGLAADHRVILWVGRMVRTKRLPLLLDAMRLVATAEPAARLVLVGDVAAAEEDIPAEIARRGLEDRVILAGWIAFDRLPAVYRAADIYALTSAYEGVPRVLQEAGAAGLPLVAMESAGARAVVVDGENGYLVPQGDVDAFARRILELLRAPEQGRAMGERGRALVLARFDSTRLFEEWMACWRETAAAGASSRQSGH